MGKGALCPVKALMAWLDSADIQSGPVFRRTAKSGNILTSAIAPEHVNVILKKLAQRSNIPNFEQISSHSLRRSFATIASQKGASFIAIMRQGRWQYSRTALSYIEAGKAFADNAANVILQDDE